MRPRVSVAVMAMAAALAAGPLGAERVNKMPVRQVETALALDSGTLKIRITLETGQALDYEIRDDATIDRVLRFVDISANGRMSLAAEISSDGRTLRALHLVPEGAPRR